jgi:hypothetical protein
MELIGIGGVVKFLAGFQEHEDIAKADGIEEGLVCVLKCVEPCYSMTVVRRFD